MLGFDENGSLAVGVAPTSCLVTQTLEEHQPRPSPSPWNASSKIAIISADSRGNFNERLNCSVVDLECACSVRVWMIGSGIGPRIDPTTVNYSLS